MSQLTPTSLRPLQRRRRLRVALVAATATAVALGGASTVSAAPSEQDTAWMVSAHQSNLAEIAAGNSAQAKATSAAVKELGAMFVEMHTQLDADLTAAATTLGVQLPTTPSPEQQQQLAAVEANAGSAYDTAWIAQQLVAHQMSLQAGQTEISTGTDPTVVALAEASAPVVQQHLTALQESSSSAPTRVDTGSGGSAAASSSSSTGPLLLALGAALLMMSGVLVWRGRRRAA
jgi:putative membrane protein